MDAVGSESSKHPSSRSYGQNDWEDDWETHKEKGTRVWNLRLLKNLSTEGELTSGFILTSCSLLANANIRIQAMVSFASLM